MTSDVARRSWPNPDVAALCFDPKAMTQDVRVSTERELVARALGGDGRAFSELVAPHLEVMFRIAARVGGRALAEDAVQEALTLVYRRLGEYRVGSSLRAFLAAVSARQAETLVRSERRRKLREQQSEPHAGEPTPAESLEADAVARTLRNALYALPEKRRQVALLRLDGGLSHAEIAEALNTSEASARSLLHLALAELRRALAEHSDEKVSS